MATILSHLRTFFAPSRAKVVLWFAWMGMYVFAIVGSSQNLPIFAQAIVRQTLYNSSWTARNLGFVYNPGKPFLSENTDIVILTASFILDSYGLSCLFVETSGRIRSSLVGRGKRKIRKHAKKSFL